MKAWFLSVLAVTANFVIATLMINTASAGPNPARLASSELPLCGSQYAPPFANPKDAGRRTCPPPVARNYTPKHRGIGYEILDLESEACFVPDDFYRLLDNIVDNVTARVGQSAQSTKPTTDRLLAIGRATGDALEERGFGLYIPTETFGDALVERNAPGEKARHIFDCDTGSFILLTVAESLSAPASLVEITLPSGSGHNYVRWQVDQNTIVDWDTNGRARCTTPDDIPSFQGKGMSREQTIAYVLTLRAAAWQRAKQYSRAVDDYRGAMQRNPGHPGALNNLAWMVATKEFPERSNLKEEALAAANLAVSIQRTPNHLDTLACIYAFTGDFAEAARLEKEAYDASPSQDFAKRLAQFRETKPRDCTGDE